jgi:hypothetical protein
MSSNIEPPCLEGYKRGIVVSQDDPLKEGRVAVYIPSLMPAYEVGKELKPGQETADPGIAVNEEKLSSDSTVKTLNAYWARPMWNQYVDGEVVVGGEYRPTQLGSEVTVIFLDGDPSKCYYDPRAMTRKGQVIPAKLLPESVKANWDDEKKRSKIHIIEEFPNGAIIGCDFNESKPTLFFVLDDKTSVVVQPGLVTVVAAKTVVESKDVVLKSDKVDVGGGASEHIVKGDAFMALYNAMTVMTPMGPSSPPMIPMNGAAHLSTKHVVN